MAESKQSAMPVLPFLLGATNIDVVTGFLVSLLFEDNKPLSGIADCKQGKLGDNLAPEQGYM